MGRVSLPETSGVITISFTTPLQLLQTPAQATTNCLAGHELASASILIKTSRKSSGGMLAQKLRCASSTTTDGSSSCTGGDDLELKACPRLLDAPPLLKDMDHRRKVRISGMKSKNGGWVEIERERERSWWWWESMDGTSPSEKMKNGRKIERNQIN